MDCSGNLSSHKMVVNNDATKQQPSSYEKLNFSFWKAFLLIVAAGYVVGTATQLYISHQQIKNNERTLTRLLEMETQQETDVKVLSRSKRQTRDSPRQALWINQNQRNGGRRRNNRNNSRDRQALTTVATTTTGGGRGPTGDSEGLGTAFTVWGKRSCTEGSVPMYIGYAAGAYPTRGAGGSSVLECLPTNPLFPDNATPQHTSDTLITAAKYSLANHVGVLNENADGQAIACAVCLSKGPTVMIPGTISCPTLPWVAEYYGYLMSSPGIPSHYCVDSDVEYYSGHNDSRGPKLTFVQAGHCAGNNAPCTSYTERKRIGCTVCTEVV